MNKSKINTNTSKNTKIQSKNVVSNNNPKILAPINDFTNLSAALDAGCDEIYFGIKGFNMRATAKNFTVEDLPKIVKMCHDRNVRAFLALNIILYDHEIEDTEKVIKAVKKAGVDAIICWDMAVIQLCIKYGIETHLSTQNSISNYESIKFFKKTIPTLKRVVLARECSLEDIKNIISKIKKDNLGIEIETFIHGAMCVSVSGRCMISHHLFGKSANRGECLQPCRRNYKVYDSNSSNQEPKEDTNHIEEGKQYRIAMTDTREETEFLLGEDALISPKDLSTIEFIEQLIDAGIVSFKIEGRNRSPEYVYTTVKAYKDVVAYYCENKSKILSDKKEKEKFENLKQEKIEKLKTVFNRGFSKGFYLGKPLNEWTSSRTGNATQTKAYVGKVQNYYPKINVAEVLIEDNSLLQNDSILIQGPTTGNYESQVLEMKDEKTFVKTASKGTVIGLKVDKKVRKNDLVYKIVEKKSE